MFKIPINYLIHNKEFSYIYINQSNTIHMKKILASLLVLTLLTACSDDNESSVNTPPTDSGSGILKKIVETVHEGADYSYEVIYEYNDGKLTKVSRRVQGILTYYTSYTYNNNLMASAINYNSSNNPTDGENYAYDELGRLKEITTSYNGIPDGKITYTFNGNTITGTTINGPTTFTLNEDGMIYKESTVHDGGHTDNITVVYDGPNVMSYTEGTGVTSYTYDTTHDPLLLQLTNGNGTYKPNAILRKQSITWGIEETPVKYLLTTNYNTPNQGASYTTTYTYTFSEQELPLTKTTHWSDDLYSESYYYYE